MTEETAKPVETASTETKPVETVITEPKKRGRPPKNPPANGDPKPVSDDGKSTTSSTRGRPKKKGKVAFSSDDLSTLSKQLVGLHKLTSLATQIPELEISDEEGDHLGRALASVAQEYDLELSGKTGAMLQLIAACGMIYVPRFFMLKSRVVAAKAKQGTLHVVSTESPAAN